MIKVLIIDDSAVVRRVLSEQLSKATDIEVVGTASDPIFAFDKIRTLRPDVVTVDIEMPRMDGLTFLRRIMAQQPMPVIVVSSLSTRGSEAAITALELGAIDVIAKPGPGYSVGDIVQMLIDRIRAAAARRPATMPQPPVTPAPVAFDAARLGLACDRIVAIGASTGGPEAIRRVLTGLPQNTPGIVIAQHMPAGFTASFAQRLDRCCAMQVREAENDMEVRPGLALIAPGNRHMVLRRVGQRYVVDLTDGPPVHHQRPAVDVLFHSVAQHAREKAVGVVLTGMGADGARGLLAMRQAGAATIAQSEASCVVFGMPREAIQLNAAEQVSSLFDMPRRILDALVRTANRTSAA